MVLSFRAKMLLVGATSASAFLLVIAVGILTLRQVDAQLEEIEARHIPLLELGPLLEADFDAIQSGLKDSVAAQDPESLRATEKLRQAMLGRIDQAATSMPSGAAVALRRAVEAYYESGFALSLRLIRGESGEALVDAMRQMQLERERALSELQRAIEVDRAELSRAFETLRRVNREADWLRFAIALTSLMLVLALSGWISGTVLRSLRELSDGFARFGEGEFTRPMRVLSSDELGELAEGGNQMAEKLHQADQRHRLANWIGTGQAALGLTLRGDLPPSEVAQRAIDFLARHTGAPAGALYGLDPGRARLELLGRHGVLGAAPTDDVRAFQLGEGLVGAAALGSELVVISAPLDEALLLRSALLDVRPHSVVFAPITHQGQVVGVVELLLLAELNAGAREFLESVREALGTAMEVARAQEARRELLARSQQQAARLSEQEERLRRANEDLTNQQRALEATNEELRSQTEELDSFSYSVSHDLRAPLRAIDGFARVLLEDHGTLLDDEGLRVVGVIRNNTAKMGRLIDDLLAFSRMGRQPLRASLVDMTLLARTAFEEASALEAERAIDFTLGDLPPAHGDPALLKQVWSNLVANAVKYSRGRARAQIEVTADNSAEEGVYIVKDNGVGFDMRFSDKLFGVFQRLHGANEFEGTGVGLALVGRIVKRHGGRVWAEAKPDAGATFYFALPTRKQLADGN